MPLSEKMVAEIREEEQKVRDFLLLKFSDGDFSAYSAEDIVNELHLRHLSSSEVGALLNSMSLGTPGRDTVERVEGQSGKYYRARVSKG